MRMGASGVRPYILGCRVTEAALSGSCTSVVALLHVSGRTQVSCGSQIFTLLIVTCACLALCFDSLLTWEFANSLLNL